MLGAEIDINDHHDLGTVNLEFVFDTHAANSFIDTDLPFHPGHGSTNTSQVPRSGIVRRCLFPTTRLYLGDGKEEKKKTGHPDGAPCHGQS